MKYRFRVSKRRIANQNSHHQPRRLLFKGRQTLRCKKQIDSESIRFFSLFEFSALPSAPKKTKKKGSAKKVVRKIAFALRRVGAAIRSYFIAVATDLKAIFIALRKSSARKQDKKSIHTLPILCGFVCATALVFLTSAGAIVLGLFAPYGRSYDSITIPDFVGRSEQTILADSSTPQLNLILQYENNPDVEAGHVISQVPHAGAVRRIYEKDEFCNVTLTVSRPVEPYVLENLVGKDERDALLILHNQNLSVSLRKVESNTVAAGCVVRTEPRAGSPLSPGDRVSVQISRGKQDTRFSVPNLVGMSETDAVFHLQSAGFTVADVSYQTSSAATGTILSQDPPAYTNAVSGSKVSLVVSMGTQVHIDTIPDLFGLSLKEARSLLSQKGLEVEQIYTVPSPAAKGTVLRQFPTHGSSVTASTRRVTLYVSS